MTQDQGQAPQQAPGASEQRVIAGRYAILGEIGRGGMGIVWLAKDRMIGRQVAIKELHLPAGVPADEREVLEERVLREARTAGRLNDPAVVTVYDVVQESGNTYIVMELIEAPTLSDIVRQSGPLPQDAVALLAGQLLSALEAAHAAGIVHRDVKPSNVMVLPNGRVKLTDFGIAQSLDDPRLTTSGILVGSPVYMAPERIHGAEADAGSDLWSLGAVLFFAVEGNAAFERPTTAATMHAITTEVPFLTRSQGPLASVIMGLLINTPQARLSAQQVRGLLAQITSGSGTGPQTVVLDGAVRYPQVNATMLASGPHQRSAAGRWLAVVMVVVLAAGMFIGGWFLHGGVATEDPEAANGGTLTYGEGGDIPEFEISDEYCGSAELRRGASYPSNDECDKPHAFQVFAASPMISSTGKVDADYPNFEQHSKAGQTWCSLVFASAWVTKDDKATTLTFVTLVPSLKRWNSAKTESSSGTDDDKRKVFCVLQNRDRSQLRESLVAKRS